MVLTVHGTFAGVANPALPHWWETQSQLAREIEARFGANAFRIESFIWKDGDGLPGPNRESERQRAGAQLLVRMFELENEGTDYHLIGHSHGGSVIWHALKTSALRRQRLSRLKSWASVATPFVHLGNDRSWWRRMAGAIAVIAALCWMGLATLLPKLIAGARESGVDGFLAQLPLAGEVGYVRDALGEWMFYGLAGAFGLAAVFFLTLLAYPFADLYRVLHAGPRVTAAERLAAEWYAALWLGLAHPRDEAISGLKATLIRTPNLVLRPRRGLASYLRGLLEPFVRPIDEFAWTILMRNAQGCDIKGALVRCVGPAPQAISVALRPLPTDVANRIEANANADAASVLARFRNRLETISNQADLEALAGILTGTYDDGSLIHTTMFEDEWVRAALVDHMAGTQPKDIAPFLGIPASRVAIPETALPFAKALAAVGAVAVVTVVGALGFREFIYPETNLAAAERIMTQLDDPAFRSIAGALPGEALVRASRLGILSPRVLAAACKFNDAQTMARAYQLIYRDFAGRRQDEELNALISPDAMKRPQSDSDLRPLILTAALEVMAQRERPLSEMGPLSHVAHVDIAKLKADQQQLMRGRLIPLASVFEDPAMMFDAARSAIKGDSSCYGLRAPLASAAALAKTPTRVDNLERIVSACMTGDQTATVNQQRELRRIAVGALPSCRHADKLLAQSSVTGIGTSVPLTPRFLECLVGAGRREDAVRLSTEVLKLQLNRTLPEEAIEFMETPGKWGASLRDISLIARALYRVGLIEEAEPWTKLALKHVEKPDEIGPEIARQFANDARRLEILRVFDPPRHQAFLDRLRSDAKKAEESQTANQLPEVRTRLRKIHAEQVEQGADKACALDKAAFEHAATMIEILSFDARIDAWSVLQSVLAVDDRCSIQMDSNTYERLLKVVSASAKPAARAAGVARFAPFRPTLRQALVSADRAGIPEEVLRGYVASVDRLRPALRVREEAAFEPLPYVSPNPAGPNARTFAPQMCDAFARN